MQQKHPEYFNKDGYKVDKDDLCKDIFNLCKETSLWKEPEWITNQQVYDVFLAHNSNDKPQIQKNQAKLEDDYKLKTWIDIKGIRGGELITEKIESAIKRSKTIAIFFGQHGEGNWQSGEIAVAIARCFEKEVIVIPVLLPGFQEENLPLFVRIFRWVKFKNIEDTEAIEQLYEGITGKQLNQHNLNY
ncbi:toll/interleukin-1 receptor domain-containing protein [Nostoc sp.]|uniref:toll/interleukin-1 receptor domain-containing protein n=1 Tax=Nostoc sp. TaxID=1180 RepID=UPI002FFA603E